MRAITDIGPKTKLCALIGNPVEHSMSPAIHNRAFSELGLEWHWDSGTYRQLQSAAGEKHCVQAYMEANHPHLLHAYAGDSLPTAVEKIRRRLSAASPH